MTARSSYFCVAVSVLISQEFGRGFISQCMSEIISAGQMTQVWAFLVEKYKEADVAARDPQTPLTVPAAQANAPAYSWSGKGKAAGHTLFKE